MIQIIIRYTQHEHMTYLYQLWEHRHDLEEGGREINLEGQLEVKLRRLDVLSTTIEDIKLPSSGSCVHLPLLLLHRYLHHHH